MMMIKNRHLSVLAMLSAMLIAYVLPAGAEERGQCGENMAWELENGRLTITGTGAMTNYTQDVSPSWYTYHDEISVVVIGEGVTSIGHYAFYSGLEAYKSLHTVYIGKDVTNIGDFAFYGAHVLKRISISTTGSLSIGENAFTGCQAVTDIFCNAAPFTTWTSANYDFIGSTMLHVKEALYDDWNTKWKSTARVKIQGDLNNYVGYNMADAIAVSYDEDNKKLTITMNAKELPESAVTKYSNWSSHKDEIESVAFVMLNSVELTGIGDGAFKGMEKLKKIEIPNTVEYIGYEAFLDCTKLTKIGEDSSPVALPANLITIGGRAFSGCEALTTIAIRDNVNHIGYMAFSSCSNLEMVHFYRNNGEIGLGFAPLVFAHCSSLKFFVDCPAEVKELPTGIFSYCTSLESFTCPRDVETIGGAAFEGCTGLKWVTLNDKLKHIEAEAFLNCSNLKADNYNATALTIPASVVEIGSEDNQYSRGAFTGCTSITELHLKANPTKLKWYDSTNDFNSDTRLACHVDNVSDLLAWGKNFRSKLKADFDMTINAVAPGDGTCWSTLYCPPIDGNDRIALTASYNDGKVLDFTPEIDVAKVKDNSVMLKNTGSLYIPQGQAVILHGESEHLKVAGAKFILTYQDGTGGLSEGDTSGNQLLGSTTAVAQESGYTYYALTKTQDKDDESKYHARFQRIASGVSIPAYKAYLRLPGAASARELGLVTDEAAGIEPVLHAPSPTLHSDWYTLGGRRLSSQPAAKGVYIHQGKKVKK